MHNCTKHAQSADPHERAPGEGLVLDGAHLIRCVLPRWIRAKMARIRGHSY